MPPLLSRLMPDASCLLTKQLQLDDCASHLVMSLQTACYMIVASSVHDPFYKVCSAMAGLKPASEFVHKTAPARTSTAAAPSVKVTNPSRLAQWYPPLLGKNVDKPSPSCHQNDMHLCQLAASTAIANIPRKSCFEATLAPWPAWLVSG